MPNGDDDTCGRISVASAFPSMNLDQRVARVTGWKIGSHLGFDAAVLFAERRSEFGPLLTFFGERLVSLLRFCSSLFATVRPLVSFPMETSAACFFVAIGRRFAPSPSISWANCSVKCRLWLMLNSSSIGSGLGMSKEVKLALTEDERRSARLLLIVVGVALRRLNVKLSWRRRRKKRKMIAFYWLPCEREDSQLMMTRKNESLSFSFFFF